MDAPTMVSVEETRPTPQAEAPRHVRGWRARFAAEERIRRRDRERTGATTQAIQGALWFVICAVGSIQLYLQGQRWMWFFFVQLILLAAFFAGRWMKMRPPTSTLVAALLVAEAIAIFGSIL
jgi:hypothetical protein